MTTQGLSWVGLYLYPNKTSATFFSQRFKGSATDVSHNTYNHPPCTEETGLEIRVPPELD